MAAIPGSVMRRVIFLLVEFPAVTDLTAVMLSNISAFEKMYFSSSCYTNKSKAQFGLWTLKVSEVLYWLNHP